MKNILVFSLSLLCSVMASAQFWVPVAINTSLKLNSISFGSDQVGYIGANDSTLFKSFDAGNTWAKIPTPGVNFSRDTPHITQVDFVSADTGYLMLGSAPFGGSLYKTTDGGGSWIRDTTYMCSPVFTYNFDSQNAFVVGSSCFGGKTIDKKENGSWSFQTTYLSWNIDYLYTIDFYNASFGMAAGDSGQVHRTLDGGLSWDTINTVTNEKIWDVQFVSDSVIYAVVDSAFNELMISIDSGKTWDFHHNSLTFFYPDLKALEGMNNESVVAVGAASMPNLGIILWGSERNTNWRVESTPEPLNNVTALNDSVAFVVGDNGLLMRSNGILNGVGSVPKSRLLNIFPNPARDRITIQTSDRLLKVCIVDVMGKTVYEGGDAPHISVAHLVSGIYYVVATSAQGTQTLPLVIQK